MADAIEKYQRTIPGKIGAIWKTPSHFFPDIVVITCCLLSVRLSIINSRFNTDAHHWGLMYANAADLHQGLIPYREIFIQYGFLTTLIQSWSLDIFGNRVVSVGIITGIFYAANIYLSYCLWQKILNKWLSGLSAVLMFLVNNYIIYPWSNYFAYTFFLTSLLFLAKSSEKGSKYLLAGVFLGLSFLARQSFTHLLFIYPYFWLIYVSSTKELRKAHLINILMFHVGILSVIGAFLLYLFKESAFKYWIAQTFTILSFYKSHFGGSGGSETILLIFLRSLIFGSVYPRLDARLLLYSLVFFNAFAVWIIVFIKSFRKKVLEREKLLFLFSSSVLFGYSQALHLYQVFRLQNSSSLGIGLLIFSLDNCLNISNKFKQWKRVILSFSVPVICLVIFYIISHTSPSPYRPWENRNLRISNKEPENIEILQGKLYDKKIRIYYETLAKTISNYNCKLEYLVNFTSDSYVPLLSKSFKRVQRSPFYVREQLENLIFQDEQEKIAKLFMKEKAILIAQGIEQIPENYEVVLKLVMPDTNPYSRNETTYVAVPKMLPPSCQLDRSNSQ